MDLEAQPNPDRQNLLNKLSSKNYVPIVCVLFFLILSEYEIMRNYSSHQLEDKQLRGRHSNLEHVLTTLKSYYPIRMTTNDDFLNDTIISE